MSKRFFLFAILAVLAISVLAQQFNSQVIPNEYIVTFRPESNDVQKKSFFNDIMDDSVSTKSLQTWDFEGFSAAHIFSTSSSFQMLAVNHPSVLAIEPNMRVHVQQSCSRQSGATWGLSRVNDRNLNLNGQYAYGTTGSGVDAYIIDTGIYLTHNEFKGRVIWGANYADSTNNDCNGHGTHVAGTVGGSTYGIAKGVTLIAVKVLACSGSGSNAGVISGIQYATNQAKARGRPSVANMSLGGSYSAAVNDAVSAMVRGGVIAVVAAGNSNVDACTGSPSSSPEAIVVGASNSSDARASFSNWGKCLSIFAPGEKITSAWIGSNSATSTISGTSMASPHVCGVAALVKAKNPSYSVAQVKSAIVNASTPNKLALKCGTTSCNTSPNKLLFHNC